jgi:hypothetical protein
LHIERESTHNLRERFFDHDFSILWHCEWERVFSFSFFLHFLCLHRCLISSPSALMIPAVHCIRGDDRWGWRARICISIEPNRTHDEWLCKLYIRERYLPGSEDGGASRQRSLLLLPVVLWCTPTCWDLMAGGPHGGCR